MSQYFKFPCHEFSFGSVNDIMTVSSNKEIPQPAGEDSACSSLVSNSKMKQFASFNEKNGMTKVINSTFFIFAEI